MKTLNDFSQLKNFKAAKVQPIPEAKQNTPEDRALEGARSSGDYFSSLLGGGANKASASPAKPTRITVVTPATINRVRQEQNEDARAAERAAFEAREAELKEELEAQTAATESIATDLANMRNELEIVRNELESKQRELASANKELESARAEITSKQNELNSADIAINSAREEFNAMCNEKDAEIERLKAMLTEARGDVRLRDSLLDMPVPFSEKFRGEVREHVLNALSCANADAEQSGRDRRARILEAVLGANPSLGELESRRTAVKHVIKNANGTLNDKAIADLEKLGFRYVSGNKHHKLEWAGIRFPVAKTPSDSRSFLNSASEICNRVF